MSKAALKVVTGVKSMIPSPADHPININGVQVFQLVLPISEFFTNFRQNTHQRDTDLRNTKHLEILQPEHLEVAALQTLTGDLILLNGHTRRKFWTTRTAVAPKYVRMTIFDIVDPKMDAAREELRLYSSFDSRKAVKTSAHTIQGSMNSTGLGLRTKWMRAGQFAYAMKVAADLCGMNSEKLSVDDLMVEFRDELIALDSIEPKKSEFVAPLIAAALVMLKKAPKPEVLDLLTDYQADLVAKKAMMNGAKSIYLMMRDYRRDGVNGNGTGRFPTNSADMYGATTKFAKYIYLALMNGDMTMMDPSSIRAFTRPRLQTLRVDTVPTAFNP